MFRGEKAVTIETADAGPVSLFADSRLVRERARRSLLEAYADEHLLGDHEPVVQVLLPTETFETGSQLIRVQRSRVHLIGDPQ